MSRDAEQIMAMASELAGLIRECPISRRYRESLLLVSKNRKSRELLGRLITMGRAISNGEVASEGTGIWESRQIQEELDTDPHVKSHLLAQREYLNLLQAVIERIRDPR